MRHFAIMIAATLLTGTASSEETDFTKGPFIKDFGAVAFIDDARLTKDTSFKVSFDLAKAAEPGANNRYLESAARFLNMHTAAGVPADNIDIAIVVHGPAAIDLVNDDRYGGPNANTGLIAALLNAGVSIELCGQTAAYRNIEKTDLLPGVKLSLSAMTSHALLQQNGYTLNPF